ncbi:MAG: threonine--tRNA ligase, partial [Chloroflexi bacterium]|nr:threonine--tRNA ligase [Chloroflexota bacterium]
KGATICNLLTGYVRDLYKQYGYQEVITPEVFSTELWKRSGHYDNYKENMFFIHMDDREYAVKPMNCPAAAIIYASQLHSYRDLPLRYADFGRLHRYERSGVTHGLTRVRTFSQDDTHIFCTAEQIRDEVWSLIRMYTEAYTLFGFDDVRIALSLRPDKRVGSDEVWDKAEVALEAVLQEAKLTYEPKPGEGAFYGPKIDFFVSDALGREWQLGTIQLDFSLSERFDLEYVAGDGSRQRPVVIHKAMLGSIERFLGLLIEHYGGAFPVWLAPVQATVIPIADRHLEYATQVQQQLGSRGLRVEVDARSERMNAKVRDAQLQKVPYMLIVGDKEVEQGAVAVRLRSGENPGPMPLEQALDLIVAAVESRS